jgi:uncharacterized membrane protein
MSDTIQNPGIIKDALGTLYAAFDVFSGVLTFILIIVLLFLAFVAAVCLPVATTTIMGVDPSTKFAGGLAIVNGIFLTFFVLFTAGAGLEEYEFLAGCWHALGVGCILLGCLLVVELVVIGIIALCSCCVNACCVNARRTKKKQDGVESGVSANTATKKDEDSQERRLSV